MVVRLLLLPGISQNSSIFRKKLEPVLQCFGTDVHYEILDPPHKYTPEAAKQLGPWFDSSANFDAPELHPRYWWRPTEDKPPLYRDAEASVIYLRDFLARRDQPFDGVLGFSQGGALGALLISMLEQPELSPEFLVDGKPPHPPLRFGIVIAGFTMRDPKYLKAFVPPPLKTPLLFVVGKRDRGYARDLDLLPKFQHCRLERHEGGHLVPTRGDWPRFFSDYIRAYDQSSVISPSEVPSPLFTPAFSLDITIHDRSKL
ncbi:serine hydrolase FSH [Cantharellus anzutake]|uniref:serine hydrolase FSH n=1 Tax=Cantharellus anzutake TaxID=1750568 RepID=UPI0019053A0A|nr:serine hydrolase FSH [Cantharellus anzutake]KAF8331375.1 serine hydrolase FSH [Cantharellus anzutake]